MPLNISQLFGRRPTQPTNQTAPAQPTTAQPVDANSKQDGETYHNWGLRICSSNQASQQVLKVFLLRVYNTIRADILANVALQNQWKQQIQNNITSLNNQNVQLQGQIDTLNNNITSDNQQIEQHNQDITRIKQEGYKTNKDAKIKLVIGLCVLVPLTFYLFLFYSSTFYSAFFSNAESMSSVMTAMFDGQALSKAWNDGVMEFCFVLSAPVIFLGLGFILHYFSVQKNKAKYLKMGAVITITFVFDCILAFSIGKMLHEMSIITGATPIGTAFGVAEAVVDSNFWAVIFCGFIVYIIWGVVFDMIMTAYDQLDLNKIEIQQRQSQIKTLKEQIQSAQQKIPSLQANIQENDNNVANLQQQLLQGGIINKDAILQEMTNFQTGWMQGMTILGKNTTQQDAANGVFAETIKGLQMA